MKYSIFFRDSTHILLTRDFISMMKEVPLYHQMNGGIHMNQLVTGKFIALKRKQKNLTQEQLAEKLGVSNKTRGKPLSDADIFKAQFYKHFSKLGKKEEFIAQWKKLEELCERIFHPISGTPMDELFTRYMYFVRAKMGIVSSTTEALRKFYEKNSYALLKDTNTLTELIVLAEFWEDVSNQDTERFSNRVLKQFFVLNYAPNGMWTYFVSVYFMQNKDDEGLLDDEKFYTFLQKITGFIWTYAITNPGVNALRTPVYERE